MAESNEKRSPAARLEHWLLAAALLFFIVYTSLDWSLFHPSFGDFEQNVLEMLQARREGVPLAWNIAQGSLHIHFLMIFAASLDHLLEFSIFSLWA